MSRDISCSWHNQILEESQNTILACLGEEEAKIFGIERTEIGFRIWEECDGYHGRTLTHNQLERLIDELKELLKSEYKALDDENAQSGQTSAIPRTCHQSQVDRPKKNVCVLRISGVSKMQTTSNHAKAGQNLFMSSVTGLANVLALVAAFLGGPTLYYATAPYVLELTYQTYGGEIIGLTKLVWFGLSYLLIFFVSRATIGTALIFGGLAIVTRFM